MENVGQALMQRRLTPNTDRLRIVGKELEEHGPISCTSLSVIRSVLWDVKVTFSNNIWKSLASNHRRMPYRWIVFSTFLTVGHYIQNSHWDSWIADKTKVFSTLLSGESSTLEVVLLARTVFPCEHFSYALTYPPATKRSGYPELRNICFIFMTSNLFILFFLQSP